MKASGSLPSFKDIVASRKSRKNIGSQNDLRLLPNNYNGISMNEKQDKSTIREWNWKWMKLLTLFGSVGILVFIVWDYWFRYGWTGDAITLNAKPKMPDVNGINLFTVLL